MSWSFRIGRILGIDIFVHATFFLLLLWVVLMQYARTQSASIAVYETAFVLIVFAIVVMHEYGHALAARAFGVPTRDITLLPIGGVARLERIPENPYQEFVIALAGPAVNVVLAVLAFAWIVAGGRSLAVNDFDPMSGTLAERLLAINIMLVVFNMIPAFPMDGGRVLRSVLAMGINYVRATQIAAAVGQMFALLLGFYGLMAQAPIPIFIALFVWIGAAQEANLVATRSGLAGIAVRQAMISDYRTVYAGDSLATVAGHVLAGFQHDFPVLEEGRVVGVITRGDLLKAMSQQGHQALVGDVMQREFVTVGPEEPLEEAFHKLQTCECHSMPVLDDGRLVGLINSENVGEFLMIRSAIRDRAKAQA